MNASEVYTQNIPICGKHIYLTYYVYKDTFKIFNLFSRMKTILLFLEFPRL